MSTMSSQKLILVVAMAAVAVATSSPWAPAPSRVVDPEEAEAFRLGFLRHTRVVITTALEGRQQLQVHCKAKKDDFGLVEVPYNSTYTLSFFPTLFSVDYFCSFGFDNTLHWFDMYLWNRDYGHCKTCNWSVHEGGPCFHGAFGRKCYPWNRN